MQEENKVPMTMIDEHLKETDDPKKAVQVRINEVEVPTWNEMVMQVYTVRDMLGTVEDVQKIMFVASILINLGLTVLLLSVK